jgi:hypothetical protein
MKLGVQLRPLPASLIKSMEIAASGGLTPFSEAYTKGAASSDGRGTVTGATRPAGYTNSSIDPVNDEEATPTWHNRMPNPPAQLNWPQRDDDAFGAGTSRVTSRPEGIVYDSHKPAKGVFARLRKSTAEMMKRASHSGADGTKIAKSMDRALELNVAGQIDDRTYQGLIKFRDLLARATPSTRKACKFDPEYQVILSRIGTAPIAQVDKDTLRKSLQ